MGAVVSCLGKRVDVVAGRADRNAAWRFCSSSRSRGRAGGKGGSSSLTAARSLTSSTALMVMGDVKMASELLAEAPLASAEEDFSDFNCNKLIVDNDDEQRDSNVRTDNARLDNAAAGICGSNSNSNNEALFGFEDSNLGAFSASLEDLVSSFDEKITKCLRDYDQTTEQIAPVQVRSQEEIMKTDQ